jgi:hypothetical protein
MTQRTKDIFFGSCKPWMVNDCSQNINPLSGLRSKERFLGDFRNFLKREQMSNAATDKLEREKACWMDSYPRVFFRNIHVRI